MTTKLLTAAKEAKRHFRATERLAEEFASAIETRTVAQKALIGAANSGDKAAFASAVFAADKAEATKNATRERYRQATTAAYPVFRRFFEEWCREAGSDLDADDDVEGAMRATLRLVRGSGGAS